MLRTTQNLAKINLFTAIRRFFLVLTSLYKLRHEVCFGRNFVTYIDGSTHFADSAPDGIEKFHLQDHRVTGDHFVFEFTVVDLEEVRVIFARGHGIDAEYPAGLCQRLDLQDAGHNRVAGEVADKEGFVERDILDPDDMPVRELDDLIDQQEGKAMR